MTLGWRKRGLGIGCLVAAVAAMTSLPRVSDSADPPASAHALVEQFDKAPYFWQQFEIAQQIVALQDRRVLQPLAQWLTVEDRHARGNAAYIFARLGDPRGFAGLVAILNDRSWRPEGQAYASISRFGPGYNAGPQISSDRYYAAGLLGDLKDPRAVPILVPLLADRDVQYVVPGALGEIGDRRAVAPLIQTLADKNPDMRVLAMRGLEQLHAKEALPAIYPLLNDPEKTHFDKLIPVGQAAKTVIAQLGAR